MSMGVKVANLMNNFVRVHRTNVNGTKHVEECFPVSYNALNNMIFH